MPTNIIMDDDFKEIFISIVVSNYKLGIAEYDRNPSYNSQHFHSIAEKNMLSYLKEKQPELLNEILLQLN